MSPRPRKIRATAPTAGASLLQQVIQFVMLAPLASVQQVLETAQAIMTTRLLAGQQMPQTVAVPMITRVAAPAEYAAELPQSLVDAPAKTETVEAPPRRRRGPNKPKLVATMPAGEAKPLGEPVAPARRGRRSASMVAAAAPSVQQPLEPRPVENVRPGVPLPEVEGLLGELE